MPRFVLLEHDHPVQHWDLMLEMGPQLRTWRLSAPPAPGVQITAQSLGDHRMAYLDYEGPVSGGRGTVARWDRGVYELLSEDIHHCAVQLHGKRIEGRLELQCVEGNAWKGHFHADEQCA
jgi:hypothetical protein